MRKGKYFLASLLALLVFNLDSFAQDNPQPSTGKNAVGIRISGSAPVINNSITYRRYLNSSLAVDGLFSFGDPVGLGAMVEKFKPLGNGALSWFWGAGAYVGFSGGRNVGAQGAVGLDVLFPSLPVNLSIDWKPELNFSKEFSFEPAALGFSARFVF